MKGTKTGGRKKGTPNTERKELNEMLTDKYPGYHPVMAMADIANNKRNNLSIIFQANKEVAKYICPQLKAVDVKLQSPDGRITDVNITIRKFAIVPVRTDKGIDTYE